MALRRFIFQSVAVGSAYFDSNQDTDEIQLAKITLVTGVAGVGLDFGTTEATNVKKATFATGVAGVAIDAGGLRITNLNLTPSANSDAVSKQYVDNLVAGVDWKQSVRATPTGNLANPTTAPGASIDGVAMVAGDRFLLKAQSTPAENGIYVWNSAASATRSSDGSAGMLTSGAAVFVTEGTSNGNTAWILTTDDPITVGTTAQVWSQFVGPGTYTASNGVSISGTAITGVANTAAGMGVDASGFKIVLNGTNPGLAFTSTYVDVKYGDGVQASATGVAAKPNASQGINVGANGIGITLAATPGLQFNSGLSVLADGTTGAIQLGASGVAVKLNGTTLSIAAAGLSVLGVPAAGTWQIGGVATSANVTAANLGTLTGGGDASALHTHAGLSAASTTFTATAAAGGLAKGDVVYVSANDTVAKGDPSNVAKTYIVGVCTAAVAGAATATIMMNGLLTAAGSGWTAGQQIFLSTSGGLTNDPTALPSRSRTIQAGIAKNATDLIVDIRDYGMKP